MSSKQEKPPKQYVPAVGPGSKSVLPVPKWNEIPNPDLPPSRTFNKKIESGLEFILPNIKWV